MTTIIKASGLRKTYPGGVEALAGIDLAVEEGEIFGFIGLNGAGKSTTIRILTTLMRATGGTATIAGLDVAREPDKVRQIIGVALQEAGLDAHATGRELLELQGRLHGLNRRDAVERATRLLDAVNLSDAADRRLAGYSGGMQRRLDLASALIHEPHVLFLDEPTTGLDPASRQQIWQEVRRLNRDEGRTIFLTSHYLEEIDRLANRVAVIDAGRIVAEGTPSELKSRLGREMASLSMAAEDRLAARQHLATIGGVESLVEITAGLMFRPLDGSRTLTEALAALDRAGIVVSAVTMAPPTLDDVFLHLTGRLPDEPSDDAAVAA